MYSDLRKQDYTMNLAELKFAVQKLSRTDKLNLIQFVASELADEECYAMPENGKKYPVRSPYDSSEASDILLNELKKKNIVIENI